MAIQATEAALRPFARPEGGIGNVVTGRPGIERQMWNQRSDMPSHQSVRTGTEQARCLGMAIANGTRPIENHCRKGNPVRGSFAAGVAPRRKGVRVLLLCIPSEGVGELRNGILLSILRWNTYSYLAK